MGCCTLSALGLAAATGGGMGMLGGEEKYEDEPLRPNHEKMSKPVAGRCWGCKHRLPREPKTIECSATSPHTLDICHTCYNHMSKRIPDWCPMCQRPTQWSKKMFSFF